MIRASVIAFVFLGACTEHGKSPDGGRPDGGNKPLPFDGGQATCADDSMLEPNDTLDTAFATPVDAATNQVSLAGLSICPATDIDNYRVTLSALADVTATVALVSGSESVAVLDASGTTLAFGTPANNTATVDALNLPPGTYFVQVRGIGVDLMEGNYSLSIAARH